MTRDSVRGPVADVIETQLRLALVRAERGMNQWRNPAVRNAFLDVWQAIRPALGLLEEGKRLGEVVEVEAPVAPVPEFERRPSRWFRGGSR